MGLAIATASYLSDYGGNSLIRIGRYSYPTGTLAAMPRTWGFGLDSGAKSAAGRDLGQRGRRVTKRWPPTDLGESRHPLVILADDGSNTNRAAQNVLVRLSCFAWHRNGRILMVVGLFQSSFAEHFDGALVPS